MELQTINSAPPGSEITNKARQDLTGQWKTAALATFVFFIVMGSAGIIPFIGSLIIGGPMTLGLAYFALKIARGKKGEVGDIFKGFDNFAGSLVAYLLYVLAVIVGFLLFVIPSIIVGLGLSQTFFILADRPETKAVDALHQSWDMMKGHKGDLFVLGLRFFGWSILCIFTLFIGYIWLLPYMQVSFANFYDSINPWREAESDLADHLIEL